MVSRTVMKTARVTAMAAMVRRSSAPASTPTANASRVREARLGAATMKAAVRRRPPSSSRGARHQVNRVANAQARTATPAPTRASLAASQRVRVTLWVKASLHVPCSNSRASSGAPMKTPASAGRNVTQTSRLPHSVWRPRNWSTSWAQPRWPAGSATQAPIPPDWYSWCMATPVTISGTATTASNRAAASSSPRCCRQISHSMLSAAFRWRRVGRCRRRAGSDRPGRDLPG